MSAVLTVWILSNILFAGLLILHRVIIPHWDQIHDYFVPSHRYHHGPRAVGH